jgi:hypothetical protein
VAYNAKSSASYCLADPPYWGWFFKPLLTAGFPQTAMNAGLEGLGFVRKVSNNSRTFPTGTFGSGCRLRMNARKRFMTLRVRRNDLAGDGVGWLWWCLPPHKKFLVGRPSWAFANLVEGERS